MKKLLLSIITITAYSLGANAQVNIPDAKLKAYLLADTTINTNKDANISTAEASAFTGTINVSDSSIADMTGIEAFTKLTVLNAANNTFTAINLSSNTKLATLNLGGCPITSIDVSGMDNLASLTLSGTQLTSLTLGTKTKLTELKAANITTLTALNMKGVTPLTPAIPLLNQPAAGSLAGADFDVTGATSLTCIDVDEPNTAGLIWANSKDASTSYSSDCSVAAITAIAVSSADGKTTVDIGSTLQMNATTTPSGLTAYTWQVIDGSGSATISTTGLLTGVTAGDVTVVAASNDNALGVNGTFAVTVLDPSGIEEYVNAIPVNVYPNPATDELRIDVKAQIESLTVVDIAGNIVKAINGSVTTLSIDDLREGMYFIKVETQEGISLTNFVKQ